MKKQLKSFSILLIMLVTALNFACADAEDGDGESAELNEGIVEFEVSPGMVDKSAGTDTSVNKVLVWGLLLNTPNVITGPYTLTKSGDKWAGLFTGLTNGSYRFYVYAMKSDNAVYYYGYTSATQTVGATKLVLTIPVSYMRGVSLTYRTPGPAGGWIFYRNTAANWKEQHYEVGNTEATSGAIWCNVTGTYGDFTGCTNNAWGGGILNFKNFMMGPGINYTDALVDCAQYTGAANMTGWWMACRTEWSQVITEIRANSLGTGWATSGYYWLSEQSSCNNAYRNLWSATTYGNTTKGTSYRARPIRTVEVAMPLDQITALCAIPANVPSAPTIYTASKLAVPSGSKVYRIENDPASVGNYAIMTFNSDGTFNRNWVFAVFGRVDSPGTWEYMTDTGYVGYLKMYYGGEYTYMTATVQMNCTEIYKDHVIYNDGTNEYFIPNAMPQVNTSPINSALGSTVIGQYEGYVEVLVVATGATPMNKLQKNTSVTNVYCGSPVEYTNVMRTNFTDTTLYDGWYPHNGGTGYEVGNAPNYLFNISGTYYIEATQTMRWTRQP